jgi:murein DD-endopeptidase MepM/ murein hydrolase activator NlpD
MNLNTVNPLDLPIVPPMDLNASTPGIDRISPYPMQLRTRASVGLFGTRRDADPGLIRLHEGVDLLAPIGTKVFAAATGRVIGGSATSALLLHDNGFQFLTYYQHL